MEGSRLTHDQTRYIFETLKLYIWCLEPTDKLPAGKKPCLSLRELEKQIDHEGMATAGCFSEHEFICMIWLWR